METIKETIKGLMQKWQQKKDGSSADDPASLLRKALAKKELKHLQSSYFRKGILTIRVDSSAWLYHLNLQKEELLNKLRSQSTAAIKDIRFYLGEAK